jgi:AraC-like DNA-binding protein
MQRSSTTKFNDADDYCASIAGGKLDLVFNCQKDFQAQLTSVELRHLRLLRGQEYLPRVAHLSLAPDLVFVAFAIRHDPPQICDGVRLQPGDIVFHSRGGRVHQRTLGPSRWGLIALAPEYLAASGKALTGLDLLAPFIARILRPSRVDASHLLRLHASACRLAETRPDMIAHPEVARAIEHDLLHALVNCLTSSDAHEYNAPKRHRMEIIARFEDIVAKDTERQLQMPELCRVIGVSERTLRTCCAEFLNMTPSRYIRLKHLNMVRAALRRADSLEATVGDLASSYGFSELGRFAGLYRTMFGETPSATLRSARITGP